MQHPHHLGDDLQRPLGDSQPGIEGRNQLLPDVLARVVDHVIVGTQQDLLFLRGPGGAWLVDRRVRRVREARDRGGFVAAAAAGPAFMVVVGFFEGWVEGPVRGGAR